MSGGPTREEREWAHAQAMNDRWERAIEAANTADTIGEDPAWDALDGLDLMALIDMVARGRRVKRLADMVRSEAKARATFELGEGNAVSDGRHLYRVSPTTERKVKDPLELLSWLGPDDAVNVINMNDAVSIERFRELAASRGGPEYAKEMEEHFFEVKTGEADLTEMPLDNKRIPKYAADMKPGEIRQGRKRKETP